MLDSLVRVTWLLVVLWVVLVLASMPALAVDGVLEINQASVVNGTDVHHVIAASGSYVLTSDLQAPPGWTGIRIDADHVTLDLNGFTLAGQGSVGSGVGILLSDRSHVTIRNGTVRRFLVHGIQGQNVTGVRILDVTIADNFGRGVVLTKGTGDGGFVLRGLIVANNSLASFELRGPAVLAETVTTGNGAGVVLFDVLLESNNFFDSFGLGQGTTQANCNLALGVADCPQ